MEAMKRMKHLLVVLLLIGISGLAAAAPPPLASSVIPVSSEASPSGASSLVLNQLNLLVGLIVPLIMAMVVLAAVAFAVGQMFGAETRARANTWASSMLVGAGLGVVIVILLYAVLPGFMEGQIPSEGTDAFSIFMSLGAMAQTSLVFIILTLIILAAVIYAAGQMYGAETRSRANVWATGMLSGAILASVIYVVLFEIRGALEGTLISVAGISAYALLVVNVSFFVAFIILITYLLTKVFKVPEWEAYLNIEFSNLMNSFLVVLFVAGLFEVSSIVAMSFVEGNYPSPPQAMIAYMRSVVADSVLRGLYDVYQINACTSMLSTFSRRIGEYVLTQTYKVFPGLDTFVSITNTLGFGLVSVYGSISAQLALAYLIDGIMTPFILPAGLLLRFFPPTRDAGAFLIALAFGFQIVFPMSYLVNKEILKSIYTEPGEEKYKSPTLLIASICGPFKYGVWGALLTYDTNPIFRVMPAGQTVATVLSRLLSEGVLNAVSMSEFVPIMHHVAALSLLAIFMPALSMVVTIASINVMTKFIVAKV